MGTAVLTSERPMALQQHHLAPAFTLPCVAVPGWGTNWRAGLRALPVPARQGYGKAVEVGAECIQEANGILCGLRVESVQDRTRE